MNVLQALQDFWAQFQTLFAFDPAALADPEIIIRLILQFFLLLAAAFFSGSETSLFSLSRMDLQNLRRKQFRTSEIIHELLDQPRKLIISILCGNELAHIAAAANMTAILVKLYGLDNAVWINVVIMVPLLFLVGEVTPKTVAVTNPVRISSGVVAQPMQWWVRAVSPLRFMIRAVSDRVTTVIVGEEKARENILGADEFRTLVGDVAEEGILDDTERTLIYNLLDAEETEIVEIMTPRTQVRFLSVDDPIPEMVAKFQSYQHSRIPVFKQNRDQIEGFMHAEDVLQLSFKKKDLSKVTIEDVLREPVAVPLTKTVAEMFEFFQKRKVRAAIVLDEFGGVEGLITLTDVLNFIFGSVSSEDAIEELYTEEDGNVYEVWGDMKLTDFNDLTNFGLEDPRMTTIGGVAFRHLDRLPRAGDRVAVEGIWIHILEMDGHRVARVRVMRGKSTEEPPEFMREPSLDGESKPQPDAEQRNDEREDKQEKELTTVGPEQEEAKRD